MQAEAYLDVGKEVKAKGRRAEQFAVLQAVGAAIVKTFGDLCEVIIHDVTRPESSIVWIGGNLTGREIGGPMTDLGLRRIRSGNFTPLYNYVTKAANGKTLKSSSVFFSDKDGKPFAALCINLDISAFLAVEDLVASLTSADGAGDVKETFPVRAGDVLDTMIVEAIADAGKHMPLLHVADRIKFVAALDRKGAFGLKKAVPVVAARLGVSRPTLYGYLKQARCETVTNGSLCRP